MLYVCSISEAIADVEVFQASTVIESSVLSGGMSIESTLGSPATEISSTVADASPGETIDASYFLNLIFLI